MSSYSIRRGASSRLLPAAIICLSVTLLSGCRTWKLDEHRRVVPRWPSARILKFKTEIPNPDGLIRYDSPYVAELAGTWLGEYTDRRYDVMVFFKDGQFIASFADDYSGFDPLVDSYRGRIGYYKVDAHRLTTESYSKINNGQYGYGFFSIRGTGDLMKMGSGHNRWHQSLSYNVPLLYRLVTDDGDASDRAGPQESTTDLLPTQTNTPTD